MVRRLLKNLLGDDENPVEEQIEIILSEISDSPDKVFIWQFSGMEQEEFEEIYHDYLADVLEHGMQSQHVVMNGEVDIDEIIVDGVNPIQVRDSVFEYVKEEE